MAIEIRIISATGDVRTVEIDPDKPIELQPGDTVVLLPDGETTITPTPDGNDLVIATPAGEPDIVINDFYVEEIDAPLPKAVAFNDSEGFKLLTPADTLVSQSHTVPRSHTLPVYEGVDLPENGQLPESFNTTSTEARSDSIEGLFETSAGGSQQGTGANDAATVSGPSLDAINQDSAGVSGNAAPVLDLGQSFNVAESATVGTSFGSVQATDPDGDALTYAITGGNDDDTYAINPTTGELTVADPSNVDFETNPTATLTVSVTDPDGASDTTEIVVNLTDVNDAPVLTTNALTSLLRRLR